MKKMIVPNEVLLEQASELLSKGIEVIIMTKGNSMRPFIAGEKDSVNLKKMDDVGVGDVVLARLAPGRYVLHRVIAVDGDALTLMGDGNLVGTESCRKADVLGTAIGIVGPAGRTRKVPKAVLWRKIRPVRRYMLWICKLFGR